MTLERRKAKSPLSGLNSPDGPAHEAESLSSSGISSPEITGDVCNFGQFVGNMWARRSDQMGTDRSRHGIASA